MNKTVIQLLNRRGEKWRIRCLLKMAVLRDNHNASATVQLGCLLSSLLLINMLHFENYFKKRYVGLERWLHGSKP